jgi:hypothetical protein
MIQYIDMAVFWHIAMTSFVSPGLPWDALGNWSQHLLSVVICQAAELWRSPHQLTFKLNLLVKDLMWLQKSGTPRSLWICLLPVHQDALLAVRRHSDWNICSFLMRVKWQASKWSTHSPSLNGLAGLQQNSISDGDTTHLVQERFQHFYSLCHFLTLLI